MKNQEYKTLSRSWEKKEINSMTKKSLEKAISFEKDYGKTMTILPFERPDILVFFDKVVLLLEHFKFDSSKATKNSSNLQQEKSLFYNKNESKGFSYKKKRK